MRHLNENTTELIILSVHCVVDRRKKVGTKANINLVDLESLHYSNQIMRHLSENTTELMFSLFTVLWIEEKKLRQKRILI